MKSIFINFVSSSRFGNHLFTLFSIYKFAKENNYNIYIKHSKIKKEFRDLFCDFYEFPKELTKDCVKFEVPLSKYKVPDNIENNYIFTGYGQNYKYIENIDLIKVLHLNEHIHNIKLDYKCVIHVRGGDYLHSTIYNILDKSYYINAINMLNIEPSECLVVSDDIDYAKKLLGTSFNYSNNNVFDDFLYIIKSNNLILSNSTFSIFAGYIGDLYNKYKVVIRPKEYFKSKSFNVDNIWKNNWIVI